MRIASIGNFGAPNSTENFVATALRTLTYTIDAYQENDVDYARLPAKLVDDGCPLVFWTRTPSFACDARAQAAFVEDCRTRGIVTCGLHLDRYWGLDREADIHKHPWFKQDYVYTADGGNQERFAAAGVNHRWWKPAVSATVCGWGKPREEYRAKVAFVGSATYHQEWRWRRMLLKWLQRTYGPKFIEVGRSGHRVPDEELADVYASVDVVVGDSCFADSASLYWSNRTPECLARGGFLLHPRVDGFEDHYTDGEHLALYDVGDFAQLQRLIESWAADPAGRDRVARAGQALVMERDTFEVRMAEVMKDLVTEHPDLRTSEQWMRHRARLNSTDDIVIEEQWTHDTYRVGAENFAGRTVIDVGANIGAFAVRAAERGAVVVAIEPEPGNVAVLREVVADTGLPITIEQFAVSDEFGTGIMTGDAATAVFTAGYEGLVKCAPLDDWLCLHDDIALLKLDVEGWEYAAITSAKLLDRCERIEIEWHGEGLSPGADGSRVAELVLKLLETHVVEVYGLPAVGGQIHARRRGDVACEI